MLLFPVPGASADVDFFPYSMIQAIASPAGADSGQPHLATAPDGTVIMSWLEPAGAGHALQYARLEGRGWSEPATVARGEDWFVNWADFPSVVPITDDVWAAHWLAKSAEAVYAYDVMLSVSDDGGHTWSAPFRPHADGTPTEHGFVTLFPWRGAIGVVWLDGRNMPAGGGMTLRSALVSPDGEVLEHRLIDDLVCDCCQTDAVSTEAGPLVAYRDRTGEEIRDIQIVQGSEAGWRAPELLHDDRWDIAGCPVNGPAISAVGRQIDAAWFTAAEKPQVRFSRSRDNGLTWSAPEILDGSGHDAPWGRVDVVTLDDGSSMVSWVSHAGAGEGRITLGWISRDGHRSARPIVLADAEPARQVGFPQMVRDGDDLIVAWTAAEGDDAHRVHTVRVTGRR